MEIDLSVYTATHRRELEALLASPEWQETLHSGLVERVRAERRTPRSARDFVGTVLEQLLELNGPRVRRMVADGCRDLKALKDALGSWPDDRAGVDPVISFLGFNLTDRCNMRCIYCNQPATPTRMALEDWKRIIDEATVGVVDRGPYLYLTGGEPLLLGEDLWGEDGLVAYATERGCAVNVNTNATLMTPQVALRLIKAGLGRLHISLDTADRALQNELCAGEWYDAVLRGIYNVQLARDLVGADYPIIHTNCVLTNRNRSRFPELLAFVLEKHKQTVEREDPFYNDLFPHLIPVGGDSNVALRPSEEEFTAFYEKVWEEARQLWVTYQQEMGVAPEQAAALSGFFRNPYLRVEHEGGLPAYARASAAGRYGKLALAERCYVAPTQASYAPDGSQYRCGSHAIRRILPIGNALEGGLCANIGQGLGGLTKLPREESCYGCALATLYINQRVSQELAERVEQILESIAGPEQGDA